MFDFSIFDDELDVMDLLFLEEMTKEEEHKIPKEKKKDKQKDKKNK